MENKKLQEMFAVVFTFVVMGIIGFALFQPDSNVIEDKVGDTAKTAVLAQDASDQLEMVDNDASNSKTVIVKSATN